MFKRKVLLKKYFKLLLCRKKAIGNFKHHIWSIKTQWSLFSRKKLISTQEVLTLDRYQVCTKGHFCTGENLLLFYLHCYPLPLVINLFFQLFCYLFSLLSLNLTLRRYLKLFSIFFMSRGKMTLCSKVYSWIFDPSLFTWRAKLWLSKTNEQILANI